MFKRKTILALLTLALGSFNAYAEQTDVAEVKESVVEIDPARLNVDIEAESYAIGYNYGEGLKRDMIDTYNIEIDKAIVLKGLEDALNGEAKYSKEELEQIYQSLNNRINLAIEAYTTKMAAESLELGNEFRSKYEKEDGVVKTESGLLYKIIEQGDDNHPNEDSIVSINYTAKFVDGTVFDQTTKSVQAPLIFYPPGVQEGLKLIGVNGKMELVLPPELAFGDRQYRNIPANSTLIYEVELLGFTQANVESSPEQAPEKTSENVQEEQSQDKSE